MLFRSGINFHFIHCVPQLWVVENLIKYLQIQVILSKILGNFSMHNFHMILKYLDRDHSNQSIVIETNKKLFELISQAINMHFFSFIDWFHN